MKVQCEEYTKQRQCHSMESGIKTDLLMPGTCVAVYKTLIPTAGRFVGGRLSIQVRQAKRGPPPQPTATGIITEITDDPRPAPLSEGLTSSPPIALPWCS